MGRRAGYWYIILCLLVFSLACNFGRSTPAPANTPVPDTATVSAPADTPVPDTATPEPAEPTPEPAEPTVTPEAVQPTSTTAPAATGIEVFNETDRDIWYLYISPSDASEWGEDQLGGDIIPAGTNYTLTDIPDGIYDAQARDANDDVIQTLWEFEVAGSTVWHVNALGVLEVTNSADAPIERLFVSPVEDSEWGPNLIEGDTIPNGGTYIIEDIPNGYYDVRVEEADETVIETLYNIDLNGTYAWTVTGKTDLPSNAVLRFEDDFSDNHNNWGLNDPEGADFSPPTNGEFCIEIQDSQMTAWEWYEPFRPDQFVAEVACSVDPNTEATCGLGFGPDGDNLYWFEVSPTDQTYALFLLLNDEWQDSLISWTYSGNIAPSGWNYLGLERVNEVVSVFINGILQATVSSDHFPTGRIGLGGATYEQGNVTVCMDNLRVWRME